MVFNKTVARRGGELCRLGLILLLALIMGACSTFRGTPARYQNTDDIVTKIDLTAQELANLSQSVDRTERNRLQNRALAVIDLRYNAFVRDLASDRADSSAALAGTTLAASTAGAFVDSVKAKTNYALFGAATIGAFSIVDKNYYFEKTIAALVAGMRAARANALLRIRQRQNEEVGTYDGVSALQDVEDYYTAGTLLAAITEITTRAEADANAAIAEIRVLEVPTDSEIDRRQKITNAIYSIKDDITMAKGNIALKSLGLLQQANPKETREALVKALQPRTKERIALVEKELKSAGLLN